MPLEIRDEATVEGGMEEVDVDGGMVDGRAAGLAGGLLADEDPDSRQSIRLKMYTERLRLRLRLKK